MTLRRINIGITTEQYNQINKLRKESNFNLSEYIRHHLDRDILGKQSVNVVEIQPVCLTCNCDLTNKRVQKHVEMHKDMLQNCTIQFKDTNVRYMFEEALK